MSKKKTEINPIRAERVKILLDREKSKDKNFTQAKFARKIYQTQQNVSRIINLKTALTEETARDIVKAFPEYRIEWLLGYDDSMTTAEQFSNAIQTANEEWSLLHKGFLSFAQLSGFQIDVAPIAGNETLEKTFQNMKEHCKISRDGKSVTFSVSELNDFENELCDYVEFRLSHIIK